ncbi:MAG TPA: hypothetical protein VJR02_16930 [Pyrinomonadaceae bacterium]|nr:hypothetical protein [Pyrinomonadaceae bacterium]
MAKSFATQNNLRLESIRDTPQQLLNRSEHDTGGKVLVSNGDGTRESVRTVQGQALRIDVENGEDQRCARDQGRRRSG